MLKNTDFYAKLPKFSKNIIYKPFVFDKNHLKVVFFVDIINSIGKLY